MRGIDGQKGMRVRNFGSGGNRIYRSGKDSLPSAGERSPASVVFGKHITLQRGTYYLILYTFAE